MKQLSAMYTLAAYSQIGWERTEERTGHQDTIQMVKRPSRCRMVGRASFHRRGEQTLFQSWIETPDGSTLEERSIENPSRRDIQRILFGVYESYLEGMTNIREIRRLFREYRI